MLGFLPGLLHAWYIIAKFPEPTWEYETIPDAEAGYSRGGDRVAYVYVHDDGRRNCSHHEQPQQQDIHPQQPTYQTMSGQVHYGKQSPRYSQMQVQPDGQPHSQFLPGQESGIVNEQLQAGPSRLQAPPNDGSVPPSYAEAIGDNKIQSEH